MFKVYGSPAGAVKQYFERVQICGIRDAGGRARPSPRAGLRRFAAAQGKPDRYHETITTAYVLLINERLDGMPRDATWKEFAARHADLLAWRPSVLDRYYRPGTLDTDRARRTFVLPDRLEEIA